MKRFAWLATLIAAQIVVGQVCSTAPAAEPKTVRDAMWIWAHYEGSYDDEWGLPINSPITPIQGGKW